MVSFTDNVTKGKRLLQAGRRLRVGRSAWADWAVHHDAEMADLHFAIIRDEDGCRIRDLTHGETLLNGAPVHEALLEAGDLVAAGGSVFRFVTEDGEPAIVCGEVEEESCQEDVPPHDASPEDGDPWLENATPREIAAWAKLSDDARDRLADGVGVDEAVAALMASGANDVRPPLPVDALRFLAFALPVRLGVEWAIACHDLVAVSQHGTAEGAALDAARRWLADPSEVNRRRAKLAADSTPLQSSVRWIAQAVAWSEGPRADAAEPDPTPASESAATEDQETGPTKNSPSENSACATSDSESTATEGAASKNSRPPQSDGRDERRASHLLSAQALSGAVLLAAVVNRPELVAARSGEFLTVATRLNAEKVNAKKASGTSSQTAKKVPDPFSLGVLSQRKE